jgi:hypothetical protein
VSTSNRGQWRSGSYPWRQPSVSDQGSLTSLTAVIRAPQSVIGGKVLRYTVELRNGTDTAVSLPPCPEVIQRLTAVPQKQAYMVGAKGPLNCAPAPAISAHSSTTFTFQLDTTGLVAGQGTLRWQLTKGAYSDLDTITEVKVLP